MRFRLIESKEDQQKFIDKFGQNLFDEFNKYKDRLSKVIIDGKPASKDLTYHVKNTSPLDMIEILNRAKGREYSKAGVGQVLDVENKLVPLPKPNGQKLIKEISGFKIYAVYDYRNMIELGSNKYGGKFGKWCVAGRYADPDAGITKEDVDNGKVKVSQSKEAFEEYFDLYEPMDPTTGRLAYIVVIGDNQKWCFLINKDITQTQAYDSNNNKYTIFDPQWKNIYNNMPEVLEFLQLSTSQFPDFENILNEKGQRAISFLQKEYGNKVKILDAEYDVEEDELPEFYIEVSLSNDCDSSEIVSKLNSLLHTKVEFLDYDYPEGAIIINYS